MSTTTEKKQITISEVQAMLDAGQDREQIRIHYSLKKSELKRLFMNPKLKGKKVKHTGSKDTFELIDDTVETSTNTTEDSASVSIQTTEDVATPTAASELDNSVTETTEAY